MARIAKRVLIWFLISGLVFSGLIGCIGDDEDDEDQALPLPPEDSMTMDFSAFGGGKMAPSAQLPGANFSNAAVRVLVLDVAVIVALAPSVAVFKGASTAVPVEQDDGSWIWSYDTIFLGSDFEADLTGSLEGPKTAWSMKVTSDAFAEPLEDFEWYTGEVALNNDSGSWRFFDYKTPDEANELGVIEWSIQSEGKNEITFTRTDTRSPDVDDILTYSVEGTTAAISFYDASEGITAEITWDLVTIEGSIQVPGYNNGERAFWDADKQDVVP